MHIQSYTTYIIMIEHKKINSWNIINFMIPILGEIAS